MISRTSTSSGLSSLVGLLRPMSHGGRAVANASVRCLAGAWAQEEGAPQAPLLLMTTSVDGRIASSEHFLINKVDARSVAGLAVSAAWDE